MCAFTVAPPDRHKLAEASRGPLPVPQIREHGAQVVEGHGDVGQERLRMLLGKLAVDLEPLLRLLKRPLEDAAGRDAPPQENRSGKSMP